MIYTGREVSEFIAVPYETLMRWARQGLLNPEGGGRQRVKTYWHAKDVREASILTALRKAGLPLQKLTGVVAYLRTVGHNLLSSGEFLLVRARTGEPRDIVKFCTTREAISLLRKDTQGYLLFRLWSPPAKE